MQSTRRLALVSLIALLLWLAPARVWADTGVTAPAAPQLALVTDYPSRVIGIGEAVTLKVRITAADTLQTVRLDVKDLPEGWTATFRGDGQIVRAVQVEPTITATVDLRLEPPADSPSGDYRLVVVGQGEGARAELPIDLTIKEKLPPRLSLEAQLPTIKGTPDSTFRFSVTLKNEGDTDLDVNLAAEAASGFLVKFKANSQEVTSLPLAANKSQTLSVEAQPLSDVTAGSYPITVRAQAGDVQADLGLQAEVAGQPQLTVTTPDGRLSAQATAGRDTAIKLVLQNTGTAAVHNVALKSTEPTGWTVNFDVKEVPVIGPGQQVEVTAQVKPPEKAVAGDYVLSFSAQPTDGTSKSADFRVTVVVSTLWGIGGIALIAVAVAVVALAVMRFGRR